VTWDTAWHLVVVALLWRAGSHAKRARWATVALIAETRAARAGGAQQIEVIGQAGDGHIDEGRLRHELGRLGGRRR
jgi:hypothetical protein